MGSLIGHVVPGTFFGIYAIYMIIRIFWEYYHAFFTSRVTDLRDIKIHSGNNNNNVRGGLKNQIGCGGGSGGRQRRFEKKNLRSNRIPPALTFFKLFSVICGMLGEYLTALDENWHFQEVHNGQHMTMFGFFLFNTVFELLYYYEVPGLPPRMDTLTGVLAFAIEGILFLWHLHGRSMLDVQVHTFLVYAIGLCVAGGILEVTYPGDIRPMLLTNGGILLQGCWFYEVGLILYPPAGWKTWDPMLHEDSMWATMSFAWTVGFVVAFQMVTATVIYQIVRRRVGFAHSQRGLSSSPGGDGYCPLPQGEQQRGGDHLKLLLEEEDEEEEGEEGSSST